MEGWDSSSVPTPGRSVSSLAESEAGGGLPSSDADSSAFACAACTSSDGDEAGT